MKSSRTTQVFVLWVTVTERGLFDCCSQPCGVSPPRAPPPAPLHPPPPLSLPGRENQRRNQQKTARSTTLPFGCGSCQESVLKWFPMLKWALTMDAGHQNPPNYQCEWRHRCRSDQRRLQPLNDVKSKGLAGILLHLDAVWGGREVLQERTLGVRRIKEKPPSFPHPPTTTTNTHPVFRLVATQTRRPKEPVYSCGNILRL